MYLRQHYQVVCFTNTEHEVALHNRKKGLFDHFEKAYISTELGLKKPDRESYEAVLSDLKIKPNQAVFIDNSQEYVQGAIDIGIHGVLYTGKMGILREDLSKLGIKLPLL